MRRNTKTMYEWRKAYRDKEELMLERGFPEVNGYGKEGDVFLGISTSGNSKNILYATVPKKRVKTSNQEIA